jgi:hypothetical protein
MLVLGFLVIIAAAGFITLRSRRMRMTAGALVVLAAGAGLLICARRDTLTRGCYTERHAAPAV